MNDVYVRFLFAGMELFVYVKIPVAFSLQQIVML